MRSPGWGDREQFLYAVYEDQPKLLFLILFIVRSDFHQPLLCRVTKIVFLYKRIMILNRCSIILLLFFLNVIILKIYRWHQRHSHSVLKATMICDSAWGGQTTASLILSWNSAQPSWESRPNILGIPDQWKRTFYTLFYILMTKIILFLSDFCRWERSENIGIC